MSVRRVMGTETEFGISVPGQPGLMPWSLRPGRQQPTRLPPRPWPGGRGGTSRRRTRCATSRGFRPGPGVRGRHPADRRGPRPGQRDTDQRVPGCTWITRIRSTPRRSARTRSRRSSGQGGGAGHGVGGGQGRHRAGSAPIQLYKKTPTTRAPRTAATRNLVCAGRLPFADISPPPHPVLRCPGMVVVAAAGSDWARTAARTASRSAQRADFFEVEVGLETTLKRPIINNPGRAARGPGEIPAPARDHRRRQHERGQYLPQARHHRAGAGHDRGQVPRR